MGKLILILLLLLLTYLQAPILRFIIQNSIFYFAIKYQFCLKAFLFLVNDRKQHFKQAFPLQRFAVEESL